MSLTLQRIEGLAPDQASLAAARKLLTPSSWPTLAEGEGLIWGECQGSGATPYRVVVSEADAGYKCTCPSRKFPCKQPSYDAQHAGAIASLGCPVFACTPDQFPSMMASALTGKDLQSWAAEADVALIRGS